MEEPKTSSIRIEPLNPAHLARWVQDAPVEQLSRFQGFLIGEWLSSVEQRFPDLLPSRSPRCLLALDGDRPVASVVARPFNRRGSCWILQLPELLGPVDDHSHRMVQQALGLCHDLYKRAAALVEKRTVLGASTKDRGTTSFDPWGE